MEASLSPNSRNGYSIYRAVWAATTGAVSIKAREGNIYGYHITNSANSTRFVKLYDTTAAIVAGTTVPTLTLGIPTMSAEAVIVSYPHGISFINGIGISVTSLGTDTDNTAPGASEVIINLFYS